MQDKDDLLIELLTEELPAQSLTSLGQGFLKQIELRLQKNDFKFSRSHYFVTPRRIAVLIEQLTRKQPDQTIERKGPAVSAAFDKNGVPTKACEGFARSCGVEVKDLSVIKTTQGEWVGYQQHVTGADIQDLISTYIEEALIALPASRKMRWGAGETQFIRPWHQLILMFGDRILPAEVFGMQAGRITRGHRFMTSMPVSIPHASTYESLLTIEGSVIPDFNKRRRKILEDAKEAGENIKPKAHTKLDPELLDEVTGLVEWPVTLVGSYDEKYLMLPPEVLISAMQAHQRYFPVCDSKENLLPFFIIISNVVSTDVSQVIHGNERVLRARLADAEFFYHHDQKLTLENRLGLLKNITFQAKLGSLFDKSKRLAALTADIANNLRTDTAYAERAGWLAKTDLTTDMVNEFPDLQGVIGEYYARQDGEPEPVALAMREQYLPKFSGDSLPKSEIGQALAIADRIDLLTGVFGLGYQPTGDKDPYALRRAALGVLRILIEEGLSLDLKSLIHAASLQYNIDWKNENHENEVLKFMLERLRAWLMEQGTPADVYAAVSALNLSAPLDIHRRIKAVQAFKKLEEAETLSIANKRVSNILAKYENQIEAKNINPDFFENEAESLLARQLESKRSVLEQLNRSGQYEEALVTLAELKNPIDNFFDHVMVMTEDQSKRENRLLLLSQLRSLFLQVADIALLQ